MTLARMMGWRFIRGGIFAPLLAAAVLPAHALDLETVQLARDSRGAGLVIAIKGSEPIDPARVRILLNADGEATGLAPLGADYLLEGANEFKHEGPGHEWTWTRIGAPSVTVATNLFRALLPAAAGDKVGLAVEVTDDKWNVIARFPKTGAEPFRTAQLPRVDWRELARAGIPASWDLRSATPFRMPNGAVGFKLAGRGALDPGRVHVMVDTNGAESGWSEWGIDLMVEGGQELAYPPGETNWNWKSLGSVISEADSNALWVVAPHAKPAGEFRWFAEMFNASWATATRVPEVGVYTSIVSRLPAAPESLNPPLPDIRELMQFSPTSLNVRIAREADEKTWTDAAAKDIALSLPGQPARAKLAIKWTDAQTGRTLALLPDMTSSAGDEIRWSGKLNDTAGWTLQVRPLDASTLDVVARISAPGDQCGRLSVGVEYPDSSWTWHDDVRFESEMDGSARYAHVGASPYGLYQERSIYPFGVISCTNAWLSVETDPAEPCHFAIEADSAARFFAVNYDLGVTPRTQKFPGQAAVHCRLSSRARGPANPFREVLSDFYQRHPSWYRARSPEHGLWMPFMDVAAVSNSADFGFAFYEKGGPMGRDVDYARANHILTLAYTEPWLYWLSIPDASQWNLDGAIARMRDLAENGWGQPREFAASALLGGVKDPDGNIRMRFLNTAWNNGGRAEVSTDPELPVTDALPVNRAMAEWRYIHGVLQDPRVDGIYLDSMSAMEDINYDAAALAVADYPCTFTVADLKPGAASVIAHMDFTAALGGYLEAHGRQLMANFPCWYFPFYMPYIDIPGEETTWYSGPRFTPLSERQLNYRRAMSGAKPFGFLQATHFDTLTGADIEKYFRECLFWAFMPSFFSHDGANDPYWAQPAYYERDRELFRTYVPITRILSRAGWTPVSAVATDDAATWIEQFGAATDATFFITARNTAAAAREAELSWPGGRRVAYDLLRGRFISDDTGLAARIPLAAGEIACIAFIAPEHLAEEANRLHAAGRGADVYEAAAANLDSMARELKAGFECALRQTQPAVAGSAAHFALDVVNRADRPAWFAGWGGPDHTPPSALAPSSKMTFTPSAAPAGTSGWESISWKLASDSGTVACSRIYRPAVAESITVTPAPERVMEAGEMAELVLQLRNNSMLAATATVAWTIGDTTDSDDVSLPPGASAPFSVGLHKDTQRVSVVRFRVEAGGRVMSESSSVVVFGPILRHLGMKAGVRVMADSVYGGYTTGPLIDGIVETAGLPWNEAAFATGESPAAHWVRFLLPAPERVSAVSLFWNSEGGETYTSRNLEVAGTLAGGERVLLAAVTNAEAQATTRISFEPRDVTSIEIRQPSGGGAKARPNLMWLREVAIE